MLIDCTRLLVAAGLLLAACTPAPAQLVDGETGPVEAVSGALSFTMRVETESLEVRLAELDAPDPDRAEAALEAYLGQPVRLAYGGLQRDRYGRALAHVFHSGNGRETWLQGALVEAGAARVLSYADNAGRTQELLALEETARATGAGIWADPDYAVRRADPDVLAQDLGSVQIVEARIIEAARFNDGRVYLNFGLDYRTDFTVFIPASAASAFADAGLDPANWAGRRVRVRGYLERRNGPLIEIDHPGRIELLDD